MSRLKKSLLVFAILVAALCVSSILYLNSRSFAAKVEGWIVGALEGRFAVEAELDRLELDLLRLDATASGLRIYQRPRQHPEPAIAVERIAVDAGLSALFSGGVTLNSVELTGPVVRIRQPAEEGRPLNLKAMFASQAGSGSGGTGSALAKVDIGELSIVGGEIFYNDRAIPLSTTRFGFRGSVRGGRAEGSYQGRASVDGLLLETEQIRIPSADVSLEFEGDASRLGLLIASLDSDPLKLSLEGSVDDFKDFAYEFDVEVEADGARLTRRGFLDFLSKAPVGSQGTLRGTGGDFSYSGVVRSPSIEALGMRFQDFTTRVAVGRDRIDYSAMRARFRNGRVESEGVLALDESLESRLTATVSDADVSGFHRVLEGRARSRIQVSWPGREWERMSGDGSSAYRIQLRLDNIDSRLPALALEGESPLTLARRTLSLSQGGIGGDGLSARFDFSIDFDGRYQSSGRLQAEWSDELLQAALLEFREDLPEQLIGRLRLAGPLDLSASIEGRGGDFDGASQLAPTPVAWRGRPMGNLSAEVRFDGDVLHVDQADLADGPVEGESSLSLPYENPNDFAVDVQARIRGLPVAPFDVFLPEWLEAGGQASGTLSFSRGPLRPLDLRSAFTVKQPSALGESLEKVSGRLRLHDEKLALSDLEGRIDGGRLSGSLRLDLKAERFESLQLEARRVPVQRISALSQYASARGRVDVGLKASGPWASPDFDLTIDSPQLEVAGTSFEEVHLEAEAREGSADFQARHSMLGSGVLRSEGSVKLAHPFQTRATVSFQELPVLPFLETALDRDFGESVRQIDAGATGSVAFQGPLANPKSAGVSLDLQDVTLASNGYSLSNSGPLRASVENELVRIHPFTLKGPQTELTFSGDIVLTEPHDLQLRLKGDSNLRLANQFIPAGVVSGGVTLDTVISGSLDAPRIVGSGTLQEGLYYAPALPTTIYNASGDFKFNPNQISIDSVSARTSMGTVQIQGGIFLDGLRPESWQISFFGNGLQPPFPEDVLSVVDIDLQYLKGAGGQLITGSALVRSAEYTRNISLTDLVTQYLTRTDVGLYDRAGSEIDLDVKVEGYRALRVRNNLADVRASAELRVRGTLADPVLLGSIIVDQGELYLEGNDYSINRGTINFNDPRRTNPNLNFEADTTIRDFEVTIQVRGPIDRLNVNFRSDPPLPQSDVVSLLAVGQTLEEMGGRADGAAGGAGSWGVIGAGRILSRALGETVESQTDRLFGLQRFSVDPFLADEGRGTSARITLGRQISDNVNVTYITDVGSERAGQIVIVEVNLLDWVTAVGTREEDGSLAIDFKFKRRF